MTVPIAVTIAFLVALGAIAIVLTLAIESLRYTVRISRRLRDQHSSRQESDPSREGIVLPPVEVHGRWGRPVDLSAPFDEPALILVVEEDSFNQAYVTIGELSTLQPSRLGRCIVVVVGRTLPERALELPDWISVVHDEHRRCQVVWQLEAPPVAMIVHQGGKVLRRCAIGNDHGNLGEQWQRVCAVGVADRV